MDYVTANYFQWNRRSKKVVTLIQKVIMMKMTTTTTNQSNRDKAPFCCEKQGGVLDHKLQPMESEIKTFGHTHPLSDNYGIQNKQQ